ncbi:protein of unknown function [Candidatus Nitrosocosmicus franklandus]|uniref:Uncharacterized protein n=1 Tax=Candidatus Nitrosocosmicus franklandianus TaxID=1798806 RepID=A0A484II96_9ARCH|nr:protein of unknown function [Candidatus Nitrosocosmicus franklandus]
MHIMDCMMYFGLLSMTMSIDRDFVFSSFDRCNYDPSKSVVNNLSNTNFI